MNKIIKSLHDRRSVRVFTEQPVSGEDKRIILEAAVQAPTAGNQQLYTILDITDRGLKEELAVMGAIKSGSAGKSKLEG